MWQLTISANIIYPHYAFNPGFFAVFFSVLGALKAYESGKIPGFFLKMNKGYYYNPAHGENWWEYYFEPLQVGAWECPQTIYLRRRFSGKFAVEAAYEMSREEGNYFINKYIKLKPHIQKKVDDFVSEYFTGYYIIGVHYRGTDKISEAPRVRYEEVMLEINRVVQSLNDKKYKIFIATDEQAFIEFCEMYFNNIVYQDIFRSDGNQPIFLIHKDPYVSGEQCLLDCLLLSRANILIRCSSNLSNISGRFNPIMPIVTLNKSVFEKHM